MSANQGRKQHVMGSWKNKIVDSSLQEERDNKDFTCDTMSLVENKLVEEHYGRWFQAKDFITHPDLANSHQYYEMTTEEKWQSAMKKTRSAFELDREKWFYNHHPNTCPFGYGLLGQNPTVLHQNMFTLTLRSMCTEEQYQKWVPLAQKLRIMGAYGQTELGHGSDVQGLETTATYDSKTDEFIINSPSYKAAKWWPGGIGCFCTHAIIFAQLIIDDNRVSVAPFIVQLRDTETFKFLPGVKGGDMGPKMGYNSQHNGWCTFDNVRIPRDWMPMKYISVDNEGCFSIEGDLRVLFSIMMNIRVQLVQHSAAALMKAVIIGLRYSVVRRQFRNTEGSQEETKLLDYQTQQAKLFPIFATSSCIFMCHSYLLSRYNKLITSISEDNYEDLETMHHLSSGMKSIFTQSCMDALNVIRQSIGGAGYSAWSGLPYLIEDFSAIPTFEGDNTVMAQQAAGHLVKLYSRQQEGEKMVDLFTYLNEIDKVGKLVCPYSTAEEFTQSDNVYEVFKYLSLSVYKSTNERMQASDATKKEKTNSIFALDLVKMAAIHIKFVGIQIMKERSDVQYSCPNFVRHRKNLLSILCLHFILEYKDEGYETGYFQKGTSGLLDRAFNLALERLRPQVIPFAESIFLNDFDHVLMSAVGNSYGDIYQTHLEWAQNSRMNQTVDGIPKGHDKYLRPILMGKL